MRRSSCPGSHPRTALARAGSTGRLRPTTRVAADPRGRIGFYRDFIVGSWAIAAVVPVVVLASGTLSAAEVGWAWPSGNGVDRLLASCMLIFAVAAGLWVRGRRRGGRPAPIHGWLAALIPRTARERRLAVAVAFTAGITEEAVYRGLLIGVGTHVFDLPLVLVVFVSLALFVANHAYQGRRGTLRVGVFGSLVTIIYLNSGSILLAVVVHITQNLVALLLAHPAAPPSPTPASRRPQSEVSVGEQAEPVPTADDRTPASQPHVPGPPRAR